MGADAGGAHTSWDINAVNIERELLRLYGMAGSLTTQHVKKTLALLPANGSSIEIGSGLGKMSFFPALLGIDVHLQDSSATALKAAEALYSYCQLSVKTYECDTLSLSASLTGKFDLSLSLGVNEHFSGVLRQSIFDVHHHVLKSGGRTDGHCCSKQVLCKLSDSYDGLEIDRKMAERAV